MRDLQDHVAAQRESLDKLDTQLDDEWELLVDEIKTVNRNGGTIRIKPLPCEVETLEPILTLEAKKAPEESMIEQPKSEPKIKKIAEVYFRPRIEWFREKSKSSNPGRTARKRMQRLREEKDRYEFHCKLKSVNKSIIMMGKWMEQEKDKIFNNIIQRSLAQTLIQETC